MPPPMPNPTKRMTAQPARPVQRYRPGKAVAEEESDDEEDSEEEQQDQSRPVQRQPQRRSQVQQEEDEDEDEEGFVTDPEDDEDGGVQIPTQKTTAQITKPTIQPRIQSQLIEADPKDEEDESEEGSDSDSDSDEQDSSSSDSEPRRKFQRPTFIKKSDRTHSATITPAPNPTSASPDPITANPETKARHVAEADILLREKLERDALARAAGRRAWDDDDENLDPSGLIDDTDNIDPPAEHAAWRLRELHRLKRDREALIAREAEIAEIERRRNLTSAQREEEDVAFIRKQTDMKEENKGDGAAYMARYHHKGAFFQDDEETRELLASRDVMGAKFEDEVGDKTLLPEFMRIRDVSKLGKKGRSKYRDLKGEDTGRFGDDVRRKRWDGSLMEGGGSKDGDLRGVDPRFLPDDDRGFGGGRGPTASGANASALGRRRSRSRSPRRKDDSYSYKPQRRSHSRSRSRSPARRKRSPSPYRDRDRERDRDWDRDKRRRVNAH